MLFVQALQRGLLKTFAERKAARADRDLTGAPQWVKDDVETIDLLLDALSGIRMKSKIVESCESSNRRMFRHFIPGLTEFIFGLL